MFIPQIGMLRLFTGISIPASVSDRLAEAIRQLRSTAALNWSAPSNWHITTKFIGAWPQERLAELQTALHGIRGIGPFEISIGRYGFFPNQHRPHTFFAGVQAGPELRQLASRLDETVGALGLQPEKREYSPHLTLAKIKGQDIQAMREHIAANGAPEFGTFHATEFHLYSSQTSSAGAVYTVLESYPLQ